MAIKTERLALPAYLVFSLLIIFPVFDSVAQLWPLNPANIQWRFGALGLASQALMTPLLGILLLTLTARFAGHPSVQLLMGILSLAGAGLCLGTAALFGLDTLDMRELVPSEAQSALEVSAAVAVTKYLMVGVIAALLGWVGAREAKEARQRSGASPEGRAQMVYKARGEGRAEAEGKDQAEEGTGPASEGKGQGQTGQGEGQAGEGKR